MSDWRSSRAAAVAAWRAGLTPEERAEHEGARELAKKHAAVRRAAERARIEARAMLDRQILALVLRGLMTEEIAAELAMAERAVQRSCQRIGIKLATPKRRRVPGGWIGAAEHEELMAIAAERGESVDETLALCLSRALEENGFHARRLLRAAPARQRQSP